MYVLFVYVGLRIYMYLYMWVYICVYVFVFFATTVWWNKMNIHLPYRGNTVSTQYRRRVIYEKFLNTRMLFWLFTFLLYLFVIYCLQDWPESLESRWINRGQGGRTSVEQRLQTLRVEQTDTFISCITRQRVQELRLVDKLPREIHKTARQLIEENILSLISENKCQSDTSSDRLVSNLESNSRIADKTPPDSCDGIKCHVIKADWL